MNSKYNLMLCELHNPVTHGINEYSDPNIESHYIVFDRYQPFSEGYFDEIEHNIDNLDFNELQDENEAENEALTEMKSDIQVLKRIYSLPIQHYSTSTIRNYRHIISRPNYIQPEIGQYIVLPTQEAIAILKTFWIRIIQKKWKKVFQERKRVLDARTNLSSIYYRQINGKWPSNCNYLPGLNSLFYSTL